MSKLPIITKEEIKPKPLPIQIYQAVYRFVDKPFLNLETNEETQGKLWMFVGLNSLNSIYRNGRKIRDKFGRIKNLKAKEHGFDALASALSDVFPITAKEVEKMVRDAIARNDDNCKFVLKSDLTPTSPDRYSGENGWLLISDIPSTDETYNRINKALKESGSSLRIKTALKYKMVLKE